MARRLHQSIGWSTRHWILALVEAGFISFLFVVPRLASYRHVAEQWKVIGRQYPSFVAHLEFTDVA